MLIVLVVLGVVIGSIFLSMRNENMKMKKQWERERATFDADSNMSVR